MKKLQIIFVIFNEPQSSHISHIFIGKPADV